MVVSRGKKGERVSFSSSVGKKKINYVAGIRTGLAMTGWATSYGHASTAMRC